jgi:uncharacterized protein YaaN involved in tellurite resistance
MKKNQHVPATPGEEKIFTRIKKYFTDRNSLSLQMDNITEQLQHNSQEISIVLDDLDGLHGESRLDKTR